MLYHIPSDTLDYNDSVDSCSRDAFNKAEENRQYTIHLLNDVRPGSLWTAVVVFLFNVVVLTFYDYNHPSSAVWSSLAQWFA